MIVKVVQRYNILCCLPNLNTLFTICYTNFAMSAVRESKKMITKVSVKFFLHREFLPYKNYRRIFMAKQGGLCQEVAS